VGLQLSELLVSGLSGHAEMVSDVLPPPPPCSRSGDVDALKPICQGTKTYHRAQSNLWIVELFATIQEIRRWHIVNLH